MGTTDRRRRTRRRLLLVAVVGGAIAAVATARARAMAAHQAEFRARYGTDAPPASG